MPTFKGQLSFEKRYSRQGRIIISSVRGYSDVSGGLFFLVLLWLKIFLFSSATFSQRQGKPTINHWVNAALTIDYHLRALL